MIKEEDPQEIVEAHMEVEAGAEVAVGVVVHGEIETVITRNITQNTKTTVVKTTAIERCRDRKSGILNK